MEVGGRSSALRECVLSSTGLDPTALSRLAQRMGAEFSGDFEPSHVTHLVAARVGSAKYAAAAASGTPIVTTAWLDACWAAASHVPHAAFALPPLSGLVVSVTGLPMDERAQLSGTIEALGGVYAKGLDADTTHLLAVAKEGDKYEAAREMGIPVLHPAWVQRCEEAGVCVPDAAYGLGAVEGDGGAESDAEWESALKRAPRGTALVQWRVHLAGMSPAQREAARRAVRSGCGTVCEALDDRVTHVVAGARLDEATRSAVRDLKTNPEVVLAKAVWGAAFARGGSGGGGGGSKRKR